MAVIVRESKYKAKGRFKNLIEENALDKVISRQLIIKKGMSMMYIAFSGERKFKTRGEHSEEVAQIGAELARRLGGNPKKARQIGEAHDFGHSVLAHTGESGLGRFLNSPDEFVESDDFNPRSKFDHSKHGVKILEITCARVGIKPPEFLINGIESHSTGSNSKGGVKCQSFEAECIMRADKIASSISDTQDMINAGVFDLSDESLSEIFDNNEKIRSIICKRIFGSFKTNEKDLDSVLELAIKLGGERALQIRNLKDNPASGNKDILFQILNEFVEEQIDKYIEKIKHFIKLPPEEQQARMINLIIDGIEDSDRKVNVVPVDNYGEQYPNGQLYITRDAEAILGGLRGLLDSMESQRLLGKTGPELEGLVETVARYVYKNREKFEHEWPFKNWKKDENNERIAWENQVAFGIAQMQDEQFKRFVLKIQQDKSAEMYLKNCKYRDPRDKEYMKKHPGVKLPFSTYDFSTRESVEKVWNVDVNREYNPPMYEQIGLLDDGAKEIVQKKERGVDR